MDTSGDFSNHSELQIHETFELSDISPLVYLDDTPTYYYDPQKHEEFLIVSCTVIPVVRQSETSQFERIYGFDVRLPALLARRALCVW